VTTFDKIMWGDTVVSPKTRRYTKYALLAAGALFIVSRAADTTPTPPQPACLTDLTQCSAREFVEHHERLFRNLGRVCQGALEGIAKYDVRWANQYNFSEYLVDQPEYLSQGYIVLFDQDVKMQNGFSAYVKGKARCTIGVHSKTVANINFSPN
jgi:hypothetical protein